MMIILILVPFDLINLKQAQRIAKWLSVYERVSYSLDLIKLNEGCIIPNEKDSGKIITEECVKKLIYSYMNIDNTAKKVKKYSYRKLNGTPVKKHKPYYFEDFVLTKTGETIGIKEIQNNGIDNRLYYMFIDINGNEKPNRIGEDIFFIKLYPDKYEPMGEGVKYASLKLGCSPLGSGLNCADYYLHGGNI